MPGSLIIKPIEAHFLDGGNQFDRMSPYCELHLGLKQVSTEVCRYGGANPSWHHPLVLPVKDDCAKCTIEVKDNEPTSRIKGMAGKCDISLEELMKEGNVRKWYNLVKDGHCEGDILVEASYLPELPAFFGTKSTPCESTQLVDTEGKKISECEPVLLKRSVRKLSDNRQDRPGRGWNMVVPEEDCEAELAEDLALRKSKSVYAVDQVNCDRKIQRRKSFWEKILNI